MTDPERPVMTIFKWGVVILILVFVLTLLSNAVGIASIYWNAGVAKLTAGPRVTQAVYGNANNIISNISYFHNQCNDIITDQQNVENAISTLGADKDAAASATQGDPIGESEALQTVQEDNVALLGVKDQLSFDVRDYDSKSANYTNNPFKAANLPYRISVDPSTGLLAGNVNCH